MRARSNKIHDDIHDAFADSLSLMLGRYDDVLYVEIDTTISFIRFDRVFKNETEMPQDYIETFKTLEEFPIETRIMKIDSIYFDYAKKNNIKVGEYWTDTSDPFLKALAEYRKQSISILQKLKSYRLKIS